MSGSGNIAHGIFNAVILKKYKISFPICITSDRIFIFKLLKYGGIKFLNKQLFFRRVKQEELLYISANKMVERQINFTFTGSPPIYYYFFNYQIINVVYLFASEVKSIFLNRTNIVISLLVPLFYIKSLFKVLKLHIKQFFSNKYDTIKRKISWS